MGIGLLGFIYWFFFGKKEEAESAGGFVGIVVDGGYKPSVIKIKKGQETKLSIIRRDSNSCLEDIILPDFKINKYLPLNENVELTIKPTKRGEYSFHCGMNMYHGKIIVE